MSKTDKEVQKNTDVEIPVTPVENFPADVLVDGGSSENPVEPQPIVNINGTEIAKVTETVIIFKAKRPLMKEEFELLSDMIKYENEKTGLQIILMPFVCEVGEA